MNEKSPNAEEWAAIPRVLITKPLADGHTMYFYWCSTYDR